MTYSLRRPRLETTDFKRAVGSFSTGVAVITTCGAGGERYGLTVNSFASVSLDPPLVLFCVAHRTPSREVLLGSQRFAVNVLSDAQHDLALRFARPATDKFAGIPWRVGTSGLPLLDGCLAHLECEIHQVVTSGDHDVIIGRAVRARTGPGDPLVFHRSRFVR